MKFAFKDDVYKRVVLTDENHKKHMLYVHRIVAYNFIPNQNGLTFINHKDENPTNNNVLNLEWCDVAYNNTYNDRHKRIGKTLKGRTPWNKGKVGVMSSNSKEEISKARKRIGFVGNQYTQKNKSIS